MSETDEDAGVGAEAPTPGMRRIKVGELQVGTPIPFDVFDSSHRLLLRRGNRISNESQLERLLRRGIFFGGRGRHAIGQGTEGIAAKPFENTQPPAAAEVSAFHILDDCARKLAELLRAPIPHSDAGRFADRIGLLAARIQNVCRSENNGALAYVLLGQAPDYAVRLQINVAIVSALMLSRLAPGTGGSEAQVCAALTMNIGMMDLQEELYWVDQPLDAQQRAALRDHPFASVRVLRELDVEDPAWLQTVEQHHEALDGSGYPRGLEGAKICKEARVIAIADRYNGMVMNRSYRPGMAPDLALKELARRDVRATDPELLGLLIKVVGVYPPGAVVQLVNKEVGVVTNRLLDLKHPIVRTFYLDPSWPYDKPIKRFTGKMPQFAIAKTLPRDELNFTIDPEQLWPPTSPVNLADG